MQLRLRSFLVLLPLMLLAGGAGRAQAAAEVHKLNLVLSGIPTQVNGGDFNDAIESFNRRVLTPFGREGLPRITYSWMFDAELRYFVKPNVAFDFGVGQLRSQSKREFLPGVAQDLQLRAEVLSVPVHLGLAYYLQPYNQGDFRAQAYFGGGLLSQVYNKGLFEVTPVALDSISNAQIGGRSRNAVTGDGPGYFIEGGAHLFFAARYSVMLGVLYRSAEVRGMVDRATGIPAKAPDGQPFTLDVGGVGARMALAIGF